jgi:hypothetical protein
MKNDQIEWAQEFLIQKGYEITATYQMLGCPYKNSDTMFVAVLKRDKV